MSFPIITLADVDRCLNEEFGDDVFEWSVDETAAFHGGSVMLAVRVHPEKNAEIVLTRLRDVFRDPERIPLLVKWEIATVGKGPYR